EIVSADGIVVVLSRESAPSAGKRKGAGDEPKVALIAVRGDSGSVLWRQPAEPVKPLFLALDRGRVIYQARGSLIGLKLTNGEKLWQVEPTEKNGRTLVAHEGVAVILGQNALEARDGGTGALLWHKHVKLAGGLGGDDLFIIGGVVWPSILSVDENQQPKGKSPHALAVGYDLRTGQERKRIFVENLRSPEHHHRCYRNKATERYLMSAMEGMEFIDLQGNGHSQNNFVRGACRYGILPANGLLYVPSDQCFCEPGAKLLGFAAVAGERSTVHGSRFPPGRIQERLERGPAFAAISDLKSQISDEGDWPTYRHDAARHGSTPTAVPAHVGIAWRVKLGGALTAPVAAGGRVYVAASDAHTVHALEASTGKPLWQFIAGGRIDSPPTIHRGLVLFGSADGRAY
ncbi:MAG: hypothetical protein FJ278_23405, partial [Planctomycetes bacterium]|nr:hypothetical protein [Planctomycetota bacterium]